VKDDAAKHEKLARDKDVAAADVAVDLKMSH
jgi:hypothetical protein